MELAGVKGTAKKIKISAATLNLINHRLPALGELF
jgi:hypothetical protein